MTLVRRFDGANGLSRGWNVTTPRVPSIFQEFDQLFNSLASGVGGGQVATSSYPVDLYETDDELVLTMAVPGLQSQDLDVSIEGRRLKIEGKLPDGEAEGRRYWVKSIPTGSFERVITLPVQVDVEAINANVSQGLLTLRLPKAAQLRARKISISEGQ